jgi:hypothetical protein
MITQFGVVLGRNRSKEGTMFVGVGSAGNIGVEPLSRRAPFTFLNDRLAGGPGLAALGAHPAFSFGANAETNTPDYDTDARRGAFLDDPASLRAWLLNDVLVGKGGRNDQNRKSGTGQNCSHRMSP